MRLTLPIKILLISAFIMNAGSFMVAPFLVVYLTKGLDFSPIEVGSILSANLIFGRLMPFITGLLGDRISHKFTLLAGMVVRGIGFLFYALFDSFTGLFIASALTGVGGAFYDPSVTSIIAAQPEEKRKRSFTFLNQALNAGAVLGPLFAAALLSFNPVTPFIVSGLLILLLAVILFIFNNNFKTKKETSNLLESVKQIVTDKNYLSYLLVMVVFWAVFTQLTVSIPLQVLNITGSEQLVSLVFALNGISAITFMFFLRKLFETKKPLFLLKYGMLILGFSLFLIPTIPALTWLLFCILIFTLGETLILPSSDIAISDFSNNKNTGGYFGLSEMAFAMGGIIGNFSGVYLMSHGNNLAWYVYGSFSILAFYLFANLEKRSINRLSENNTKRRA